MGKRVNTSPSREKQVPGDRRRRLKDIHGWQQWIWATGGRLTLRSIPSDRCPVPFHANSGTDVLSHVTDAADDRRSIQAGQEG